ncbi:MAG TPA: hypothetical protein VHM67_13365 [Gemmatimonadaceae bacterium]|nr:hypothetical protein [Gemmatimonadaceae bacterium]
MSNPPDSRAGARTTRLGLVALGFVIGVVVTLIGVLAIGLR